MMETLPQGTILNGRYRIERALGSGGFGHVYQTVDLRTNQQYAIKEYLVTGSSGQEQLDHEARVLGRLHHPNLPAFQESFSERGRYYIVLSYIEGNDLTDYIRAGHLRNQAVVPIERILGWMFSTCDAIHFLHTQQPPVIHRDIKPDNIRITPQGIAVLVDLGNAKATADGARTLFFIRHQGTPGYAPPEQYPGGTGTDVRSDVYALGGTLYFALTAHEPPSVSTRNQSLQQGHSDLPSLQELLANNPPEDSPEANAARQFRLGASKPGKPAHRHSPHLAQLGMLPPELLERLNRITRRALAMRPKERYQSIEDLRNELHSVLAALPTQTPPTVSPRPIDPHSTQPDLPLFYDAMLAAKENKDQGSPDAQSQSVPKSTSTPPVQPTSSQSSLPAQTPPSAVYCPRCNTPLVPQAVFCPRCGFSLTNMPKADGTARSAPESNSSTNNPALRNQASARNIIADQPTVVRPPSLKPSSRGFILPKAAPPNIPPPIQQVAAPPTQMRVPPIVRQNTPPGNNNVQGPAVAVGKAPGIPPPTPSPAPGFTPNTRIIIAVAVAILVLLLVLLFILFVSNRL